jgi:hypothetical protein
MTEMLQKDYFLQQSLLFLQERAVAFFVFSRKNYQKGQKN